MRKRASFQVYVVIAKFISRMCRLTAWTFLRQLFHNMSNCHKAINLDTACSKKYSNKYALRSITTKILSICHPGKFEGTYSPSFSPAPLNPKTAEKGFFTRRCHFHDFLYSSSKWLQLKITSHVKIFLVKDTKMDQLFGLCKRGKHKKTKVWIFRYGFASHKSLKGS